MLSSKSPMATIQPSLLEETCIYNSKTRAIFLIIALLVWLFGGVNLIYYKVYWVGVVIIILVLVGIVITYKVLTDNTAQLIITTKGITTMPMASIHGIR